jgi:glycosyltransferase involved in cell wall biosynthesis
MAYVSVVIAVYNGEATIARAIESVLAQDCSDDFEIIVADDGSTDGTRAILETYQSRIRVIRQNNRGAAAARNAGVAVSSGEVLAFVDADDVWLPQKLRNTVPVIRSSRRIVLVYSDAVEVDEEDRPTALSITPPHKGHAPSLSELLTEWWPILPSTAMIRRDVFETCGGFPEALRAYEDPYLFLLAREHGEFAYVPEPLVRYRRLPVGERMEKYAPYQRLFIRMVRQRYGRTADARIKDTKKAYTVALGHQGLIAMRRGDKPLARQSFAKALRRDPMSLRTALRLLRTFLPRPLAYAMSGRRDIVSNSAKDSD